MYIEKMKQELTVGGWDSVMEMLYSMYREGRGVDTERIRAEFKQLDAVLRQLPLGEMDRVWNLTCDLCIDHQQAAYFDGIKTGVLLMLEAGVRVDG